MEVRGIFDDDSFGESGLEADSIFFEEADDGGLLLRGADGAYEDVGIF